MFWLLLIIGYDHSVRWEIHPTEAICWEAPVPANTDYHVCLKEWRRGKEKPTS